MYVSEIVGSFDDLVTEARAGRDGLDLLPAREVVRLMNTEDALVAGAVGEALDAIAATVEAVSGRLRTGGRLIYVGAGTSGRLAATDAAECIPTFNISPDLVQALIPGGAEAFWSSIERPEDDAEAGRADLASLSP